MDERPYYFRISTGNLNNLNKPRVNLFFPEVGERKKEKFEKSRLTRHKIRTTAIVEFCVVCDNICNMITIIKKFNFH